MEVGDGKGKINGDGGKNKGENIYCLYPSSLFYLFSFSNYLPSGIHQHLLPRPPLHGYHVLYIIKSNSQFSVLFLLDSQQYLT